MKGDLLRLTVDIPGEKVNPLEMNTTIPEKGEEIVVIGSPMRLSGTVSDGIVSAVREVPAFGYIIQITAAISPGSSGSPVLNINGDVIGVAALQVLEGQNFNFAVPVKRVKDLKSMEAMNIAEWNNRHIGEKRKAAEELYEKAILFKATNSYVKAVSLLKEAIEILPDYSEAYFQLGGRYCRLKNYEEAIKTVKEAIRIKPDYADAHCLLGLAYSSSGTYKKAIECFKLAIRIKPDHAEAHYSLGCAYLLNDSRELALEEYRILKELDSEKASELLYVIGLFD